MEDDAIPDRGSASANVLWPQHMDFMHLEGLKKQGDPVTGVE